MIINKKVSLKRTVGCIASRSCGCLCWGSSNHLAKPVPSTVAGARSARQQPQPAGPVQAAATERSSSVGQGLPAASTGPATSPVLVTQLGVGLNGGSDCLRPACKLL